MKKIKFDQISFMNRWRQKKHHRNDDWTILGISEHWFCPTSFYYKFSLFGLDLIVWFDVELIDKKIEL